MRGIVTLDDHMKLSSIDARCWLSPGQHQQALGLCPSKVLLLEALDRGWIDVVVLTISFVNPIPSSALGKGRPKALTSRSTQCIQMRNFLPSCVSSLAPIRYLRCLHIRPRQYCAFNSCGNMPCSKQTLREKWRCKSPYEAPLGSSEVYLAMDDVGTGRSLLGNVGASTFSRCLSLRFGVLGRHTGI